VEFGEPPSVETPVDEVTVVHRFSYIRQVFQNKNGAFDGLGILHDFAGDTVKHVVYLPLHVVSERPQDVLASARL
jgi:hypothetical protein